MPTSDHKVFINLKKKIFIATYTVIIVKQVIRKKSLIWVTTFFFVATLIVFDRDVASSKKLRICKIQKTTGTMHNDVIGDTGQLYFCNSYNYLFLN